MTRSQLLAAGVSRREVEVRVENGTLHLEHRGVYRVGHKAPSTDARYMAAVLACGPGALISGRAAAYLHRLIKGAPPPPELTAPTERRVPGLKAHRCRRLDPRDAGAVRRIPVTKIPRTLLDLAAWLTQPQLARAAHEAWVLHHVGAPEIEAALARKPNAPGAVTLRRIVFGDVNVSLSALESRFSPCLKKLVCRSPRQTSDRAAAPSTAAGSHAA